MAIGQPGVPPSCRWNLVSTFIPLLIPPHGEGPAMTSFDSYVWKSIGWWWIWIFYHITISYTWTFKKMIIHSLSHETQFSRVGCLTTNSISLPCTFSICSVIHRFYQSIFQRVKPNEVSWPIYASQNWLIIRTGRDDGWTIDRDIV